MTWYPIGPDFVFAPRNPNFKRLSRRDEMGRQGLAKCIAVDPSNPKVIYVVDRPSSGGTAVFRTKDGGASWKCLSDDLHQATNPRVDPRWIAINPSKPNVVYLATAVDQGLYISIDRGDTWGARKAIPGRVNKLIVDPRAAGNLAKVRLIAACHSGVYTSDDAGDSWDQRVTGDAFSLAASIPASGTAHFYAGVKAQGLFHATDPTGTWTNLNGQNLGLPAFVAGDGVTQEDNFHHILVDVCPKNPDRAYAWLAKPKGPSNSRPYVTEGIYTTASPTTKWDKKTVADTTLSAAVKKGPKQQSATPASMTGIRFGVILTVGAGAQQENVRVLGATSKTFEAIFTKDHAKGAQIKVNPPNPAQGWYNYTFAVAPNSPGDGVKDILFFGRVELFRSTDAGLTWEAEAWDYAKVHGNSYHADQHSFAFYPDVPKGTTVPLAYVGCDGGISVSTRYCDPAFEFAKLITDYNEGQTVKATGLHQNLNHGRQCSALYQYSSYRDISALNYIGCQDTGVNGGVKTFGWRGLADADGGAIAVAPGKDGLIVWGNLGSPFNMVMWTDKGDYRPGWRDVKLGSKSGPLVKTTSNYELAPGDVCLTGAYVVSPETSLTAAVSQNASPQAVTPAGMGGIQVGSVLTVDEGDDAEDVTVTATTSKTFTAVFDKDHAKGAKVGVNRSFIARAGQDGIAREISQDFTPDAYPGRRTIYTIVMPDPSDPDLIVCATGIQRNLFDKVWFTTSGSTAGPGTLWYEAAGNKPANANVFAIAIAPNHDIYLLLKDPVNAPVPGGSPINTPLFKLSEGDWVPQVCSGNPATTPHYYYGKLVAHPTRSDTLFAAHAAAVYKLQFSGGQWGWKDISSGLPGQWIYDLWIGFTSQDRKEEHVILRAGIPTRGIWEHVLAYGEDVPAVDLYLRDHMLDQGLLKKSEAGIKNPYNPKRRVRHYQCADIKVDVQQPAGGGAAAFFQTDPEGGAPPFSHVLFDQLQDHSRGLKPGAPAWVHAQVSNRSYGPVNNVNVWAIYCNASAGVPALSKSASHKDSFKFWGQFKSTGAIVPNLPADSPWKSVGKPVELNGLDVFNPRVASWKWKVPKLATGDPGHYCMVVFVHGGAGLIGETGYNVDYMTPRNRQIGQKNLHIGAPLSPKGGGGTSGASQPQMNAYVEFHNPEPADRTADLRFDFSSLPPELAVTLQFTPMDTAEPIEGSIEGVRDIRRATVDELIRPGGDPGWRTALCGLWNAFCGFANWILGLLGREPWDCSCQPAVPMPEFTGTVYEVEPGADVVVREVRLGGLGSVAAFIRLRNAGELPEGSRHPFEVQQLVGGEVLGGSTYMVVVEGEPEFPPMHQFPFVMEGVDPADWDRIERESKDEKFLPPWAADIVREREAEAEK